MPLPLMVRDFYVQFLLAEGDPPLSVPVPRGM
jgi:hypothetical protein